MFVLKQQRGLYFSENVFIGLLIAFDLYPVSSGQHFFIRWLQVLLPFTRDSTILEHFQSSLANPPRAIGKKANVSQVFPPSGVIPFHGFSMYGKWIKIPSIVFNLSFRLFNWIFISFFSSPIVLLVRRSSHTICDFSATIYSILLQVTHNFERSKRESKWKENFSSLFISQSILGLCLLFERLLQWREPEIFFHLRSNGIQP